MDFLLYSINTWKIDIFMRAPRDNDPGRGPTQDGLARHHLIYFGRLKYRSDQVRDTNWTDEILWQNKVCVVGERREYTALSLTRKSGGLYNLGTVVFIRGYATCFHEKRLLFPIGSRFKPAC